MAPTPAASPGISLVLSAGAYRGAAHIGVIRAFERAGIPIELVVGTSAGALAGMMYSAGVPVDHLDSALRAMKLEDVFTSATGPDGFTDMAPIRRAIEALLGARREIASFPRRFACVAADAITGEAVVLSSGNAASAVQASMALPGLVRPVRHGDRLLVDGGVVQPVPVSVARSLGARLVVAVDVNVPRFGGLAARHPAESFNHCFDMAIHRLGGLELQTADVIVRPDLSGMKQDLGNVAGFLRAGEAAGEAAVAEIRQRLGQRAPADKHAHAGV